MRNSTMNITNIQKWPNYITNTSLKIVAKFQYKIKEMQNQILFNKMFLTLGRHGINNYITVPCALRYKHK